MVLLKFLVPWPLAGVFFLLTSCWSPVFDPNVSLAALTNAKLSQDAQFQATINGSNNSEYFAVPSRERTPSSVALFALTATSYSMEIFASSGGGWSNTGSQFGSGYGSPVSDPESVSVQADMPGSGFSLAVYLPTLGNGTVQFLSSSSSSTNFPSSGTTPGILGMTAFPSSTNQSDLNLLVSPSSNQLQNYQTSSTPGVPYSTPVATGLSLSGSLSYGWYAYDEVNAIGYFTQHSQDSSGRYTSYGMTSGGIVATWTRKDRVVAFLTTGSLLTREGGYYDVCDSHGTVQFSFPAGSLKFSGEYFDSSGTARCSFTEVLPVNGSNSDSSAPLTVTVYSTPTSNLSSLK